MNQVLYDHLSTGDVIGAFATLTPFLKLYSAYARNFPCSQHLLNDLHNTRKGFTTFVKKQEELKDVKGLKLPALLIMPIQRIPRYKLLLEELKKTTFTLCRAAELDEVLTQVNDVAEYVNECVRDYDNSLTILNIQKRLDSCAPKLMVPGRKFIMEGMLKKVSQHGKRKMQDRMVWLFSDVLIYGKPDSRKRNRYLCSCVFPLRHCYTERIVGQNMIKIACKGETLYLASHDFETINTWINSLEAAIVELRETRRTLRKDSSCRTPQRRKLLNAARRRTSSLSRKVQRKRLEQQQAESSALSRHNEESHCDRWFDGVRGYLKGKRKRSSSPVRGVHFSELGNSVAKRPRLAASPRLATLPEEDSDASSYNGFGLDDSLAEIPDANLGSPKKKTDDPWWTAHETPMKQPAPESDSSFFKKCSIM